MTNSQAFKSFKDGKIGMGELKSICKGNNDAQGVVFRLRKLHDFFEAKLIQAEERYNDNDLNSVKDYVYHEGCVYVIKKVMEELEV